MQKIIDRKIKCLQSPAYLFVYNYDISIYIVLGYFNKEHKRWPYLITIAIIAHDQHCTLIVPEGLKFSYQIGLSNSFNLI